MKTSESLTLEEKADIITEIAVQIEKWYVDEKKGLELKKILTKSVSVGKYDSISSKIEFLSVLTTELQNLSQGILKNQWDI